MQYRLRYKAHDLELPPGEFLIGRSEECQLALDDPMVSRRHAALRVSSSGVVAIDLGSRNGVLVNGEKIKSERKLDDGDRVAVGGHELVLVVVRQQGSPRRRLSTRTLGAIDVRDLQSTVSGVASTPPKGFAAATPASGIARIQSALPTLAGLADKALALGRVEEAERLLVNVLNDMMRELRKEAEVDGALLERASGYALKLAGGANKASWVDWVVEAYYLSDRIVPAAIADELALVARKVRGMRMDLLNDYVESMVSLSPQFGPNERFVLKRIEGLRAQLTGR